MASILISVTQHEQYCLILLNITINRPKNAATLFKKRLWHRCFPVDFAKFPGKTFL